jgi:hypothetical protein
VTALTPELSVTVRGTADDVGAVTPEDISILADLQDVSSASGSYTVSAVIRVNTDGDIGVVGTYQVRVTIADEEPTGEEHDTNRDS